MDLSIVPVLAPQQQATEALQVGDLMLDRMAHSVTYRAREVHLSPTAFRLLEIFMQNAGRVLSRQALFDGMQCAELCCHRTIDVYVGRLRKALSCHGERIRTVRGAGYVLGDTTVSVRTIPSPLQACPPRHLTPDTLTLGSNDAPSATPRHCRFVGDIEFDPGAKRVRRLGRDVSLTPQQFHLLDLLMSTPGKVYSRAQIIEVVYGNAGVHPRTVDMLVGRLRKAMNVGALPDPIRTVLAAGYKFSEHFEHQFAAWATRRRKKLQLPKMVANAKTAM